MKYVSVDVTFKYLRSKDLPGPLLRAGNILIISELLVGKYPIQFAENNPVFSVFKSFSFSESRSRNIELNVHCSYPLILAASVARQWV